MTDGLQLTIDGRIQVMTMLTRLHIPTEQQHRQLLQHAQEGLARPADGVLSGGYWHVYDPADCEANDGQVAQGHG